MSKVPAHLITATGVSGYRVTFYWEGFTVTYLPGNVAGLRTTNVTWTYNPWR